MESEIIVILRFVLLVSLAGWLDGVDGGGGGDFCFLLLLLLFFVGVMVSFVFVVFVSVFFCCCCCCFAICCCCGVWGGWNGEDSMPKLNNQKFQLSVCATQVTVTMAWASRYPTGKEGYLRIHNLKQNGTKTSMYRINKQLARVS